MVRITLLSLILVLTAQAAGKERNPFQSYHDRIAKLEKQIEGAKEKDAERLEVQLEKLKKSLEKAVESRLAPHNKKLKKLEKSLNKTKSDRSKKRIQKQIDSLEKKVAKINAWGSSGAKKDEKDDKE